MSNFESPDQDVLQAGEEIEGGEENEEVATTEDWYTPEQIAELDGATDRANEIAQQMEDVEGEIASLEEELRSTPEEETEKITETRKKIAERVHSLTEVARQGTEIVTLIGASPLLLLGFAVAPFRSKEEVQRVNEASDAEQSLIRGKTEESTSRASFSARTLYASLLKVAELKGEEIGADNADIEQLDKLKNDLVLLRSEREDLLGQTSYTTARAMMEGGATMEKSGDHYELRATENQVEEAWHEMDADLALREEEEATQIEALQAEIKEKM